jgi:indole-3-glycerol phosphate synthase
MRDVLDEIIQNKRLEIEAAKRLKSLAQVQADCRAAPPARDFFAALSPAAGLRPKIIAECKKQSPSRGVMVKDYDPVALAKTYVQGGAAAVSVLTDKEFFGGDLQDLKAVRAAIALPVLCKDFIIDEYQIYEARAAGADGFLLLSGVLAPRSLEHLLLCGRALGMEPLIESHTPLELEEALTTSGRIFGINNRNLKDFSVDLERAKALYAQALGGKSPHERLVVCESGIKEPKDVKQMRSAGYDVFLIGEALATGADPAKILAAMLAED